jgi:WD40 repeat protein/serine/threonine protein kinase
MTDDSLLGQLAEEFTRRVREGKLPDIEEYANRYPALAGRIRELFPTLMLLEGMAATSDSAAAEALPSGLASGSVFGQYRIKREIGRGGMGIVYEAVHLLLEKRVALKVLPVRTPVDAAHLERFFREARTAAGLHHTNIVPVFDVGQVAGTPYYAMQYIEGRGLDRILKLMQPDGEHGASADVPSSDSTGDLPLESPAGSITKSTARKRKEPQPPGPSDSSRRIRAGLPARQEDYFRWVAGIGIQAAEGLAYAHERKVVHRDIKPSNLLLDNQGVLWIADFGLAKRIEDPAMTQSGTLIGTPRYMSPEQAEAARRPVDQRSDIYSLGVTLYELLTCRAVFEGKTPQEVLSQILAREPVEPRRLNAAIPADLETVVMKAMAKRPEDRYPTASQFAEDLQRWLKMEPIKARRIGLVGRTTRWCRRNPKLAVVTAVAAAIVLTLSGIYYWSLIRENANTRLALQHETEARNQVAVALSQSEAAKQRAEAARAEADDSRKLAETERDSARIARDHTKAALDLAKRQSYVANLAAASALVRDNKATEARNRLLLCEPSMRGWEWHHLYLKTDASLVTLQAIGGVEAFHSNPYLSSSFGASPDGKLLFWSTELSLGVWENATYAPVITYGPFDPILAVKNDGTRILLNVSKDKVLRVLDPVSGQSITILALQKEQVSAAAFSPDGKRIVTGCKDGMVRLWDATSGKNLADMKGHTDWVRCLVFTPDGTRIASGSLDKTLRFWDAASGKILSIIQTNGGVNSIAFSPDARRVAAGLESGQLELWDAASGQQFATMMGREGNAIYAVAFSPDGSRIVCGKSDGTVSIWDAASAKETIQLTGLSNQYEFQDPVAKQYELQWPVITVAFTPDGRRILSGDMGGQVRVWDAGKNQGFTTLRADGSVYSIAFSPDGTLLVSGSGDKTVRLWNVESGKVIASYKGHDAGVRSVAFTHDGRRIVSGSEDKTIRIWDIQTGKAISTLTGHESRVRSVAVSPDGRRIASVSNDKTVRIWDAASGKSITIIPLGELVHSVAFSPDDARIVTGSGDPSKLPSGNQNKVRIWDAASGRNLLSLGLQRSDLPSLAYSVAFGPDGKRVAAADLIQRMIGIWDASSGKQLAALAGPTSPLGAVAFSPDGRRIIGASVGNLLYVYDAVSYDFLLTLQNPDSPQCIVFSPDGTRIASGNSKNTITIWDTRSAYPPELDEMVPALFRQYTFANDVIRHLQADTRINPELRKAALQFVQTQGDSLVQLSTESWNIVKSPGGNAQAYRHALQMQNS